MESSYAEFIPSIITGFFTLAGTLIGIFLTNIQHRKLIENQTIAQLSKDMHLFNARERRLTIRSLISVSNKLQRVFVQRKGYNLLTLQNILTEMENSGLDADVMSIDMDIYLELLELKDSIGWFTDGQLQRDHYINNEIFKDMISSVMQKIREIAKAESTKFNTVIDSTSKESA